MREMVLNHASLQPSSRPTSIEWLKGLMDGMSELLNNGVAQTTLRVSWSEYETTCLAKLWGDPDIRALRRGRAREDYMRIMGLFDRSLSLGDVGQSIEGCEVVVAGCKAKKLSPEDSVPLKFCANTNAIAVGFPSGIWDCDRITVNGATPKTIDNLTRSAHAQTISERHRAALLQYKNGTALWENRERAFPHLKFGLDVKHDLAKLGGAAVQTAINRLARLNKLAAAWRSYEGAAPPQWNGVRDERERVKTTPRLREARRFKSHRGKPELFFLHTGFRGGKRIYFRFDPHKREVEIGYIGPHLPIPTA